MRRTMHIASAIDPVFKEISNGREPGRKFPLPNFSDHEKHLPLRERAIQCFVKLGFFNVCAPAAREMIEKQGFDTGFSRYDPLRSGSMGSRAVRKDMKRAAMQLAENMNWGAISSLVDCKGLEITVPRKYADDRETRRFWFDALYKETGTQKPSISDYFGNCLTWLIKYYDESPSGPLKEFYPEEKDLVRKRAQIHKNKNEILKMGDDINLKLLKPAGERTVQEMLVMLKIKEGKPLERKLIYGNVAGTLRAQFAADFLAPFSNPNTMVSEVLINGCKYVAQREGGRIAVYRDEYATFKSLCKPMREWGSKEIRRLGAGKACKNYSLHWLLSNGFSPEGQELFKSRADVSCLYERMEKHNRTFGTSIRARLDLGQEMELQKADAVVFLQGGDYKIRNKGGAWLFFECFEPWEMKNAPNGYFMRSLLADSSTIEGKAKIDAWKRGLSITDGRNANLLPDGKTLYFTGGKGPDFRLVKNNGILELWLDKRSMMVGALHKIERQKGMADPSLITHHGISDYPCLIERVGNSHFLLLKMAYPELAPSDMKNRPKLSSGQLRKKALAIYPDWDGWFAWKYPHLYELDDGIIRLK